MCLAVPVRVVERVGVDEAIVDLGGIRKQVSLALVENVAVGDYVILHVGYALTRLDADEAARTLALFAEAGLPLPPLEGEGQESGAAAGRRA
jgi:hydrogenase expression/formation protein HypC